MTLRAFTSTTCFSPDFIPAPIMPRPTPDTSANFLQAVRAHYGLSFALLAGYLDTSASLLGQAATNRRELPTAALLRLRPLAEALPPPWGQGPREPAAPSEPALVLAPALLHPPDPDPLRQRLAECRHLAARLTRALASLARRQAQARHLLALLPTLTAAAEATLPPDARAARWLPLFAAQARERLAPGPSAELALLQARRRGLLLEAAQLADWLAEVP